MWRCLFSFIVICFSQQASGLYFNEICSNNTQKSSSCSSKIIGHNNADYESCKMEYFPSNSAICKDMNFGPISTNLNIGEVSLKPYILNLELNNDTSGFSINYTVLNITFSNIKWKTMKFRFQQTKYRNIQNHCRSIVISNEVTINDQSVLYYDCYWSLSDGNYNGQSHILDYEATDDKVINRGQFYFNIPSAQMLSEFVTEKTWKPFIYLENLSSTLKLHILPPIAPVKINSYKIEVIRECDKGASCIDIVEDAVIMLKNNTHEITYEYSLLRGFGSYYFLVTPLHDSCIDGTELECQGVESPRITLHIEGPATLNICIASLTALFVAALFAYYVVLRVLRKYYCIDYRLTPSTEIPTPTKVLAIYSSLNRLHADCVASFVNYLRSEYGFEIVYDGDINSTSHGDPYIWAEEAYEMCTHVMYIVGPADEANHCNNIYERPIITTHKEVDKLLLALLRTNKTSKKPKEVLNVFFEHSDGQLPVETKHEKVFFLLKDWHKLISFMSSNLLPKKQLLRTEKGRTLMDDLTRAKKLLNGHSDDVVIKCEKSNLFDNKKVLL